jgi:ABC-type transporter Mla subunit MlaD
MAKDDRSRDDLISELINALAGPVSTGMRAVGQANQRRAEIMEQLDHAGAELRRLADVTRRMIDLLDEIEAPLRAAVPQIARLSSVLGDVLDEAPDDLGRRVSNLFTSLERLGEGLAPLLLLAQGASGMFGGVRPPTTSARATTAAAPTAPAAKAPAKKSPAKKAPAKKASAKKATATPRRRG